MNDIIVEVPVTPRPQTPKPATPVAAQKATPFVPRTNPLDRKAYDRREVFVDTDGDGRRFDVRQPGRKSVGR